MDRILDVRLDLPQEPRCTVLARRSDLTGLALFTALALRAVVALFTLFAFFTFLAIFASNTNWATFTLLTAGTRIALFPARSSGPDGTRIAN
jgi:hypothetical protein